MASAPLTLAPAADWPQFRGPQRNGISTETGWQVTTAPKRLWSAQVGEGYSSVAVAGGRVYTVGNDGRQDTVWCLNADTGKPVWKWSYPAAPGDYSGPRATPTVDGKNVYILSREGGIACLNAESGKVVWGKDLRRELRVQPPRWGFAGSPLVYGTRVLFNVGSAGIALDKLNGNILWNSGRDGAGYASPMPYAIGAQKGVAVFTANALVAVDPQSGRQLWRYEWRTNYDVNAADPVFSGDTVFLSSNYEKGCALLRIQNNRPTVLWQNRNMRNHTNGSVLVGGNYFGNDQGTLRCLDARTGAERWQSRGMGKGGLIAADGKLLALTERGDLLVIQAKPEAYTEISRAKVMGGECWTHPVLANSRLYCRSHNGELVCLDVKGTRAQARQLPPTQASARLTETRPAVGPPPTRPAAGPAESLASAAAGIAEPSLTSPTSPTSPVSADPSDPPDPSDQSDGVGPPPTQPLARLTESRPAVGPLAAPASDPGSTLDYVNRTDPSAAPGAGALRPAPSASSSAIALAICGPTPSPRSLLHSAPVSGRSQSSLSLSACSAGVPFRAHAVRRLPSSWSPLHSTAVRSACLIRVHPRSFAANLPLLPVAPAVRNL